MESLLYVIIEIYPDTSKFRTHPSDSMLILVNMPVLTGSASRWARTSHFRVGSHCLPARQKKCKCPSYHHRASLPPEPCSRTTFPHRKRSGWPTRHTRRSRYVGSRRWCSGTQLYANPSPREPHSPSVESRCRPVVRNLSAVLDNGRIL